MSSDQPLPQISTNERNTYRGCKLLIPDLLAIVPVMNGSIADPVCPNPAIQPMQLVSRQRGRTRPASFMTIGYIGPSRTPTSETVTPPPIRAATSQTTSSRLGGDMLTIITHTRGEPTRWRGKYKRRPPSVRRAGEPHMSNAKGRAIL